MQCLFLQDKICLGGLPSRFPLLEKYAPSEEELKTLCKSDKFSECPRYKEIKEIIKKPPRRIA